MPDLAIELLGAPSVRRDGAELTPKRRKTLALLAYLVTEPRRHARERLATLLWPDSAEARKLLRHAVYELKQCLGTEALGGDRDRLWIDEGVIACCDIDRLRRLAEEDDNVQGARELDTLCSGEFLEGMVFDDSEVMDDWCYATREQVARQRSRLLERMVRFHRHHGNTDTALALLRQWQCLEKLDETVYRQRIELHMARGEPTDAQRVFNTCQRLLAEELGIRPSAELASLLDAPNSTRTPAPPDPRDPRTPETHYIQSGHVFLAYQTLGTGPRTLVVVNGFMSHLEQIWENPALARFYRALSEDVRLVLFDKRGSGMSDRVAEAPTATDIADDIHHLVTAHDLGHVSLFGFSEGGAAAVEFAARHPCLTDHLILYGSAAKWTRSDDYPPALTPQQFDQWQAQLIQHWGRGVTIREFAPSQADDPATFDWWAKSMRLSSSPGEVARILASIRNIDVRHQALRIQCPTLILHKTHDRIVRYAAGRDLAERIPGSRLCALDGQDHWFWTEEPERVLGLIRGALLSASRPHQSSERPGDYSGQAR